MYSCIICSCSQYCATLTDFLFQKAFQKFSLDRSSSISIQKWNVYSLLMVVCNHQTNITSWFFPSMHSSSGYRYTLPPNCTHTGLIQTVNTLLGFSNERNTLNYWTFLEQMHLRLSLHWIDRQNRSFTQMKSDVKARFDRLWTDTLNEQYNVLKRDGP